MKAKEGKISGLAVAIVLAVVFVLLTTLLTIETITDIRRGREELLVSEKAELELPQFGETKELEHLAGEPTPTIEELTEEEKEEAQEVRLKDLPTKKSLPEKESLKEKVLQESREEEQTLEIRPSAHDIEELKKRGLIIY